ncbi:MAG TPA: flagellar biosynthesis protein FlhA [Euzebyales bacterium]|nr:flagellar biosynthesis protein FlhA [Euzebyales bacterium]
MRAGRSAVPLFMVGAVMMMVVPIPPALMDVMLALNIALAVLILLSVISISDSMDLSVFPSLILLSTLLRLSLNVSSTRLVLLDGYAGKVIETFGNFVVGGSLIVGLVVFLILVVIQFVVITNGAGRVAEVSARFSLDAMPGKQMAVDADLSAGLIDEREALTRRRRIAQESDFYGAMDGASKFVKGDAIAGIVITVINLLGGFSVGVVQHGLTLGESLERFSLLTVGDGLVSQIPALLMSIATGLLVTRSNDDSELAPLLASQLLGNPKAVRTAGIVVGALGLLPGLPKVPFFVLAGGLLIAGSRAKARTETVAEEADVAVVQANADDPEALVGEMRIESLELHLAYDALDLIDPARGGDLLERVRSLRRQIALELGLIMPYVRTRDDVALPSATYEIMLHGVEVGRSSAPAGRALALPAGDGSELLALGGQQTVEPVFGLQAFWIHRESESAAAAAGATVVDRASVIITHLAEVVRSNAAELLSLQQVQLLIEGLRADEPLLANEVGGDVLSLTMLHRVLQELLRERVGIRDLVRIVGALAVRARQTQSLEHLVSGAREAVGPAICAAIAPDRMLDVVTLDPALENLLHEHLREVDGVLHLVVAPDQTQEIVDQFAPYLAGAQTRPVALVCGQLLRRPLQRVLSATSIAVPVLAYPELSASLDIRQKGVIGRAAVDA